MAKWAKVAKSAGTGARELNAIAHRGHCHASDFRQSRCCAVALLAAPAAAQDIAKNYPNRAIHIVVPFPAGGPADVAARLLGQRMSEDWGQPVIVDNRPGGNTVIGAQQVAKAAPDGYTLLMAIDSTLVMNQYLYKSLPYDPINDFAPITTTTKTVSVLTVGLNGPKSVKELIAQAKAEPGKLNYGAGTITAQLMGHRFHKAAGLDIVYVPFKGTPETVNGLLTGSVQIIYAANVTVNPLIESGKVRALAKLDRRTPGSMENIPTLADAAGLPDLEDMSVWLGLVAPKGTPTPIIDKLQQKVAQIMADPAMREKSERTGAFPMTSTPEQFGQFIREEAGRWQKVLQETKSNTTERRHVWKEDAMRLSGCCIALAGLFALALGPAAAQDAATFPNRSIKIVVPFPAGGPSDVLARLIGQKMSEDWGQPVVIENRPGANTVIGAQIVKAAAPDGYTMLMAIDSTLTMNQFLYRTPPYDPINDFAPVTLVAKTMQLLMVNAASDNALPYCWPGTSTCCSAVDGSWSASWRSR